MIRAGPVVPGVISAPGYCLFGVAVLSDHDAVAVGGSPITAEGVGSSGVIIRTVNGGLSWQMVRAAATTALTDESPAFCVTESKSIHVSVIFGFILSADCRIESLVWVLLTCLVYSPLGPPGGLSGRRGHQRADSHGRGLTAEDVECLGRGLRDGGQHRRHACDGRGVLCAPRLTPLSSWLGVGLVQ